MVLWTLPISKPKASACLMNDRPGCLLCVALEVMPKPRDGGLSRAHLNLSCNLIGQDILASQKHHVKENFSIFRSYDWLCFCRMMVGREMGAKMRLSQTEATLRRKTLQHLQSACLPHKSDEAERHSFQRAGIMLSRRRVLSQLLQKQFSLSSPIIWLSRKDSQQKLQANLSRLSSFISENIQPYRLSPVLLPSCSTSLHYSKPIKKSVV